MSFIKELNDKIQKIMKGSGGESGSGKPNLDELATNAVTAFEDGSLDQSKEAVTEWAKKKGLDDEEAGEFASEVLEAYKDATSAGEGDDKDKKVEKSNLGATLDPEVEPETEDPANAGDPEEPTDPIDPEPAAEDTSEVLKSLLAQNEVLLKGFSVVLDQLSALSGIQEEQKVLKSMIETATGTAAPAKAKTTTGANPPKAASSNRVETLNKIMKGVTAGKLGVSDVSLFEQKGFLTPAAEQYIASEGVK